MPKIWFVPGGGGNWLNYMFWCHMYDRIIPGNHSNFHLDTLQSIDPTYRYVLDCTLHDSDWRESVIVFGSHQSQLNMLINVGRKIGYNTDPELMFWNAWNFQENYNQSVRYNIQWHLIVTDPEFMLACLNDCTGKKLSYTPVVQHAFQQYIDSCWPPELQGDNWRTHPLTHAWIDSLKYRGISDDEVYNHWTPYYPNELR